MRLSLEFLGTGTSVGVPVIGCDCAVCTSEDALNKRLRSSALVRGYDSAGALRNTVVIDTTPDFRQQMLRSRVRRLDAILLTHFHADHVVGIDDMRRYNAMQNEVLDCFASPETLAGLRRSFGYAFADDGNLHWGLPCIKGRPLEAGQRFEIGCLQFEALDQDHVIVRSLGFLIRVAGGPALAYCLDVKGFPEQTLRALEGVDTLVLDMLRPKPHPTHLSFDEALAVVERLRPRRTFFGHMAHEVEHREFSARLPAGVALAYDGLVLEM